MAGCASPTSSQVHASAGTWQPAEQARAANTHARHDRHGHLSHPRHLPCSLARSLAHTRPTYMRSHALAAACKQTQNVWAGSWQGHPTPLPRRHRAQPAAAMAVQAMAAAVRHGCQAAAPRTYPRPPLPAGEGKNCGQLISILPVSPPSLSLSLSLSVLSSLSLALSRSFAFRRRRSLLVCIACT